MKTTLINSAVGRSLNTSKRLLLVLAAALVLAATGCKNTARGVGEDVEKAGEKIQEKTK